MELNFKLLYKPFLSLDPLEKVLLLSMLHQLNLKQCTSSNANSSVKKVRIEILLDLQEMLLKSPPFPPDIKIHLGS